MFVVFHTEFPQQDKRYFKTKAGAKRSATCSNRNAGKFVYNFVEESWFELKYGPVGTKVGLHSMASRFRSFSNSSASTNGEPIIELVVSCGIVLRQKSLQRSTRGLRVKTLPRLNMIGIAAKLFGFSNPITGSMQTC